MPRGITPRRPSRSGLHRGVRPTQQLPAKQAKGPSRVLGKRAQAIRKSSESPTSSQRVNEILRRLEARYPGVTCALHHKNAWELLVATILSAQCTDVRVNMTTPELFQRYPTPQAMAQATPVELEPQIRSTEIGRASCRERGQLTG